jgi:hypothetical protein
MALYKKKISVGKFAKKGEDYRDGDILIVLNEGKKIEGQYGEQDVFMMRFPSGEDKNLTFNQTSLNNLVDAFGPESSQWVDKKVKVWLVLQNVQGKMTKVTYLSAPDWKLNDVEGELFVAPGTTKEISRPEDIPF